MRRLLALALWTMLTVSNPMTALAQSPQEETYRDRTNAAWLIKVQLQDVRTGERTWFIAENRYFVEYLAEQWDRMPGQEGRFSMDRYVSFMTAHEDKPIEVDLTQIDRRQGYDRPLTLDELGYASIDAFLTARFDYDDETGCGIGRGNGKGPRSLWDPRVIGLLMDHGFNVRAGHPTGGVDICRREG